MKRRLYGIFCVVMCVALIFTGCGKNNKKEDTKENDEISTEEMRDKLDADENLIAMVDDVGITQADYNLMYKVVYDQTSQYSQSYGEGWYNAEIDDNGTTIGAYMKNAAMDSVVELIAVSKLAEERGIKADSDVINEQVQALKEQYGGEEGYKSFLDEHRTTEEAVRIYFERFMLYDALLENLSAEEDFSKEYTRVQHILISTQDGRSEEDALALAQEVIAKLNGGADFDSLIDEYDEDPGMTSGNYYTFPEGQMVAEFEEASKKLKVGEYTKEPVKTEYGYHIIKRYELTAEGDEYESFRQQKFSEMLASKTESLHIEKKEDVIDKNIEEWLKELGVDTSAKPSVGESE